MQLRDVRHWAVVPARIAVAYALVAALTACGVRATHPAPSPAPLDDETAVLEIAVDSIATFGKQIVVGDSSDVSFLKSPAAERAQALAVVRQAAGSIDSTTVQDLDRQNATVVSFRQRLHLEHGWEWKSAAVAGGERLESATIVTVSRPGFNAAHTEAIVYGTMYCGTLCAEGSYVVLDRARGGGWRVRKKVRIWES
jgi:hypothetical protein